MRKAIFALMLLSFCNALAAQNVKQIEQWVSEYEFEKARAAWASIFEADSSSAEAFKGMVEAQNGLALLDYAARPKVIASKKVEKEDFFLYYSHLEDKSWRSEGCYFEKGQQFVFLPDSGKICFSRQLADTLWSTPEPLFDEGTEGDETLPLLSYDGSSLYFSSNDLYGVGGYDIYVSHFDPKRQSWGRPVNLGFPFNSPADDFLYSETQDGKYALFASNRDCGPDEVIIYVLEYENWPRQALTPAQARENAVLKPSGASSYQFRRFTSGGSLDLPFRREEEELQEEIRIVR